jgi:hypothetical protein
MSNLFAAAATRAFTLLDVYGAPIAPRVTAPAPAPTARPTYTAPHKPLTPINPDLYKGGAPLKGTLATIAPNPKRPGSAAHARYALYDMVGVGGSLDACLKVGVLKADFLWDLRRGFITLAD